MLIDMSVRDFLREIASSSPAPGGGSASAAAGAMGAALTEMVINLTVGKKKYAAVAAELSALLPPLRLIRSALENAIDRDTEAFNQVMKAFALPKEAEEQIKTRALAIQEATLRATEVPLSVMEAAAKALEITLIVAQKGNKNSASDAGVAGLLLSSAIDGAALNVRINLPGLPDTHPFKSQAVEQMRTIALKNAELDEQIKEAVAGNI